MPTNLDRASLVSRAVQIESVTVTRLAMSTDVGEETAGETVRLTQRYRAQYDDRRSNRREVAVRVHFLFEAHTGDAGEPGRRVADIEAELLVVYGTDAAEEFPGDALRHFASLNGTYNAWPYWRELVQNLTARAGISGVTVPVFRPMVREVAVQENLPALSTPARATPVRTPAPEARTDRAP